MSTRAFRLAVILGLLTAATAPGMVDARTQIGSPVHAPLGVASDSPAAQLRTALNGTLAEHAFLLSEAMRTGVEGGAGFESAGAALEANTVQLVDMIESVYGAQAASSFGDLWRDHIAFLIDYTRALADDDADAQTLAQDQLADYVAAFSALLAGANPNLPESVVADLIAEHVQQLQEVAHFSIGEYSKAYPALRHTYAHMYTIGDGLARAIILQFRDTLTGGDMAFSPAADLRISLDRFLGEHTILAMIAMRSGLTRTAGQEAAADALAQNTTDLSEAIGRIYGGAARNAFAGLWRHHTDAYLRYVAGVAADDQDLRTTALDQLRDYQTDLTNFLAVANPNLDAGDLTALLRTHTEQLVAQADAYAAGDYDAAYDVAHEAFAHSGTLAEALASAIATQVPEMFPDTATAEPRPPRPLADAGLILVIVSLLTMPPYARLAAAPPWRAPRRR